MVTSPYLIDTYRQYKKGTDKFVQWLSTNARKTGTVEPIFENRGAEHTKASRKCKGRLNAKGIYDVPISAFVPLAKAIVSHSNIIKVPKVIIWILEDVIKSRKDCAAWYLVNQDREDAENKALNDGHRYFICVLMEVYKLLLPLRYEGFESSNRYKEEQQHEPSSLSNMFEYLEVEDAADIDYGTGRTSRAQPNKKDIQRTYKTQITAEETSFALYCFLKDLTDIRLFVRDTWKKYKHYRITLGTAASVMNAAIGVFRRLNDAFVERFPDFQQHQTIMNFLCDGHSLSTKDATKEVSHHSTGVRFTQYATEDLTMSPKEFFCEHVHWILLKWFQNRGFKMYNTDHPDLVFQKDEIILLKCLSMWSLFQKQLQFFTLETHGKTSKTDFLLAGDELWKAVDILGQGNFPTWTIFAVQLFVDTNHELGYDCSRGFTDLQTDSQRLMESLKFNFAYSLTIMGPGRRDDLSSPLWSWIRMFERAVFSDCIQDMVKKTGHNLEKYDWGEYFFLKHHPMLCGILLQEFLIRYHQEGCIHAELAGAVRPAIHLYNAALLSGFEDTEKRWADLEYIIEKHGEAWLFVGSRPRRASECAAKLLYAYGTAPSVFARNSKGYLQNRELKTGRLPRINKKAMRRLKYMSRCAQLWEQLPDSKEKIRGLLSRAAEDPSVLMEHLVNTWTRSTNRQITVLSRADENKQLPHRTSLESMQIFEKALKADEFALHFDMFALHNRCAELLGRVQKMCTELSPLVYPKDIFGSMIEGPVLVAHILLRIRAAEDQPSCFLETSQFVGEVVRLGGNVEYLRAESFLGIVSGPSANLSPQGKYGQKDWARLLWNDMLGEVPKEYVMDDWTKEELYKALGLTRRSNKDGASVTTRHAIIPSGNWRESK